MSEQLYYEDSNKHGSYQFVTLEQVISDYMANVDQDDYTSTVHRHKLLYQAMRGIRELYYDVMQDIKAIELELGPTLNVVLPPDFVNYVRISWIDDDGSIRPMSVDSNKNIATSYLQDNNYEILFDADGRELKGGNQYPSPDTSKAKGYRSYKVAGYTPNINLSNIHKNGSYRIDKSNGIIQFSSDVESKSILLEYISDGLYTGSYEGQDADIKVHKFAEQALLDWIYYNLIKNRRNVPGNEKLRARKEYYHSRNVAKRRINALRKEELIQAMSGSTMVIEPEY